jgi:hypothetical protein
MIDNYVQTTGFGAFGLRSSSVNKKEWKRSQFEDEPVLCIAVMSKDRAVLGIITPVLLSLQHQD